MIEHYRGLVDHRGQPIKKATLTVEISGATTTGVRTPTGGYPGDGLNPARLAAIMREADAGDPIRYLELAETIEERDPHLIGVLGTRRRSVAQLEITVEDGGSDGPSKTAADMVRDWIKRDELSLELFDILDAIHKGYSFTEIIWGEGKEWWPERLEWRDPRWFDFERRDLRTPRLITEGGAREPLAGGKFIFAPMQAKSGIPTRGGLARVLAWAWMFKALASRDWSIFLQTYGMGIRVGKYQQGATEAEKQTLYQAVANIAGDCAAIIPQAMEIEFIEARGASSSGELYRERAEFLDQQASKAVLGQTATTDAVTGGLGSGKEHRQVQEDIERADAKQLSAILNRELIGPWMQLSYPGLATPPRVRIGRPEEKDVKAIVEVVRAFSLPMKRDEAYKLAGVAIPEAGDDVVTIASPTTGENVADDDPTKPPEATAKKRPTLHAETTDPGELEAERANAAKDRLASEAAELAGDALAALLELVGGIVTDPQVRDLEDVRGRLLTLMPNLKARPLAAAMRQAIVVAELTGRADQMGDLRADG